MTTDDLAVTDIETGDEVVSTQEGEVIVVTGSTIERRDLTTPAPLAVLNKETLEAAGLASVGDILQNLPSQSNAINIQFNNGGDGATRVNLRGIGTDRTLVLINGRRHVPGGTGADSSVDLNSIPLAVIERVEVLKDGASAIYGSDAIGGVVNIITRQNFDGTEASIYAGSTQDGLGFVYDLSVAAGHNTDRGSIVFSAGYHEQRPMHAGEREFSKSDKYYDWATGEVSTNGSSAVPAGYLRDRLGDAGNEAWDAVVANCAPADPEDPMICYNDTGGWREFQATGNSDVSEGDFYNYQPENYLVTPQNRYNMYSAGNFQFNDHVRGFFEASYTNRKSDQRLAPTPLFTITEDITVSANNHYNPFARDFIDMRRRFIEAGPRRFFQDVNTFRLVTGIDGKLPEGSELLRNWRWELSYNYGRTDANDINEGRFVRSRVVNALGPSHMGDDGNPACGSDSDNAIDDCVPLNLFGGEGTITPAMIDYISYTGTAKGFNEQQAVTFSTSGRLFRTPYGGDVALAVGASYRDESGGFEPDPITASGDTTGNKEEPTLGGYDVYSAFAELSAVPVVGKQGAEWIELTAAARAFNYSTFGSGVTWKAGGLWKIGYGAAVRGTYSTAFRAPSVNELFSGARDSFDSVTDPCDTSQGDRSANEQTNCSTDGLPDNYEDDRTQIRSQRGGNPELEPETARIFTLGAVYEPPQVPGLSFTLDYFNISIEDAIQRATTSVILANCYDVDPAQRTDCERIERDETGFIRDIIDTETNIGGTDTAGMDFNIRYDHTTEIGRFRHSIEGTWLHQYDETVGETRPGVGVYDLGVYPDLRFNLSTLWGLDGYGAGANIRYIHPFRECQDNDCKAEADAAAEDPSYMPLERDVAANVTADLFLSYAVKSPVGLSKLTVGINNLLNQEPAVIYNGFLATSDASTYDYLGRYAYARFVQSF